MGWRKKAGGTDLFDPPFLLKCFDIVLLPEKERKETNTLAPCLLEELQRTDTKHILHL